MRGSRLVVLALSSVVSAGLLGVGHPPAATASCVGPSLAVGASVDPAQPPSGEAQLERGTLTTVSGIFFHRGCEDTQEGSALGCHTSPPSDPESPLTDVELILVQGDHRWVLDTADASGRDQLYAISWMVTVPADAAAGSAELRAATASQTIQIS